MSYYEPPSEGARRCMIWRNHRVLTDGCDTCGMSATYCGANREVNHGQSCCESCSHG